MKSLRSDHVAQGPEIIFRAVDKRSSIAAGCSKPAVWVPRNKSVDFAGLQITQTNFWALTNKIELDPFCCFDHLREPMGKSTEWNGHSLTIEFLDRGNRRALLNVDDGFLTMICFDKCDQSSLGELAFGTEHNRRHVAEDCDIDPARLTCY